MFCFSSSSAVSLEDNILLFLDRVVIPVNLHFRFVDWCWFRVEGVVEVAVVALDRPMRIFFYLHHVLLNHFGHSGSGPDAVLSFIREAFCRIVVKVIDLVEMKARIGNLCFFISMTYAPGRELPSIIDI